MIKAVEHVTGRVGRLYSRHEQTADAIVHVLGILFAINASLWLLWHVTGLSVLISVSVYCLGLLAMTGFSAAYNLMPHHRPSKKILRRLDHAAIFIMIAATYTPLAVNRLSEPYGDIILAVIWLAATFGVVMKVLFPRRFEMASIALYLGMGWLAVIVIHPLAESLAGADFWLLVAGGLVYSAGVFFYLFERIPYNRAIWHAFVLTAAVLQFSCIWGEFAH
ncbi:MAG: hemolysin III family protein [Alphaproteobacteria bacterium]|nr:hemolysin III family protein [Alphaproteobacteria bacterium]MDE2109781.1 hemolysin III family protein [Alphaproteobacteria bacterium]MDE2495668.1 hemolysin III family protein [Alphaproteobacteria bacterium]